MLNSGTGRRNSERQTISTPYCTSVTMVTVCTSPCLGVLKASFIFCPRKLQLAYLTLVTPNQAWSGRCSISSLMFCEDHKADFIEKRSVWVPYNPHTPKRAPIFIRDHQERKCRPRNHPFSPQRHMGPWVRFFRLIRSAPNHIPRYNVHAHSNIIY